MKTLHHGEAIRRHNKLTGTIISLYDGRKAGLDTDGGNWSLVCESHGSVTAFTDYHVAASHMGYPEWCQPCQDLLPATKPPKPEPRDPSTTDDTTDRYQRPYRPEDYMGANWRDESPAHKDQAMCETCLTVDTGHALGGRFYCTTCYDRLIHPVEQAPKTRPARRSPGTAPAQAAMTV